MTVNFRHHYRERQDARTLPRLEELVDLELEVPATPAPKRARINRDPKTEARPKTLSAEGRP